MGDNFCPAAKALSLTAVAYDSGDTLGKVLALVSLIPIIIPAQLAALFAVRRDWQTLVLGFGVIFSVVLNKLLKDLLKIPRPLRDCDGVDSIFSAGSHEEYGMPSNHSQLMAFVSTFASMYLVARVRAPRFEVAGWVILGVVSSGLVAYSRVYLWYHTTEQVLAGLCVGTLAGAFWFGSYLAVFEPLGRCVVAQPWSQRLFLKDHSGVRNVVEFEFDAIHGSNYGHTTEISIILAKLKERCSLLGESERSQLKEDALKCLN